MALACVLATALATVGAVIRPPLGATYQKTMRFPVIGTQQIMLSIISEKEARLILSGRLNLDQPVAYDVEDSGDMRFSLTDATMRLLRRFRTSLEKAGYDPATDSSWVVVWPPLPLAIRVKLERAQDDSVSSGQQRGIRYQYAAP